MRLPERIDVATFRALVNHGRRRMFLACLSEGEDYKQQVEMIGQLGETFVGLVRFYLVTNEDVGIRQALGVQGAPMFIGFANGSEVFRILGNTEFEELALNCRRLFDDTPVGFARTEVGGADGSGDGESCRSRGFSS